MGWRSRTDAWLPPWPLTLCPALLSVSPVATKWRGEEEAAHVGDLACGEQAGCAKPFPPSLLPASPGHGAQTPQAWKWLPVAFLRAGRLLCLPLSSGINVICFLLSCVLLSGIQVRIMELTIVLGS